MRLTKARVTNYKCVLDSGEFTLGELTCLVGKNESGKTAILEAIEKLNPVRSEREGFTSTDFPRVLGDPEEQAVAIRAEFTLSDEEKAELTEVVGCDGGFVGDVVVATKGYDTDLGLSIPLDHKKVVTGRIARSGLSKGEKSPLAVCATISDLIKKLEEMADRTPRQEALLAELLEDYPSRSLTGRVNAQLGDWMPSFVYYSQYDRLPGRVQVERIRELATQGTLEAEQGAPVFMALMRMVGLDPNKILDAQEWEPLVAKFESVSLRTSRHIFQYWSQNKSLKIRFDIHGGRPLDPPPYNAGTVFETRIENTRHGASIRLDERSTGFIWFFSFLVWFSEVQKAHGDNLVVLLDEPGLTLHAKAQGDLLRYMKDELVVKYQVLYTTHSPFMVDAADIGSARTVEDANSDTDDVLGTKVGDKVLSADGDTLFPLRAALGYDISQTLFVGEHCLLVEGPSDLLFLKWASDQLRSASRAGLDPRWTVTPCGGITKVPSFVSLFGGNNLHVAVLTDHGTGDRRKVREIRESDLLRDRHVLTADDYSENGSADEGDTEDILGRSFYLALVNATYGLTGKNALKVSTGVPSLRVVSEVENHFRGLPGEVPEYDHYAPASYLVQHPEFGVNRGRDGALDRFERLFLAANALL